MKSIRFIGGLMAAVPLGVLVTLSYVFGRDVLGEGSSLGPLYGILLGSFGLVGAIVAFSVAEAWHSGQRGRLAAAVLILILATSCSALASTLTLGARQASIVATAERAAEIDRQIRTVQSRIDALPAHRLLATISAEIRIREEAARRNPRTEPFPAADRIALSNEAGVAMRADELRTELAALALKRPAARPAAAIEWLAEQMQKPLQTVGLGTMMAFILAGEVIGALGLFVVWGSHSSPTGGARAPEPKPETQAEPRAPAANVVKLRPEPAPVVASAAAPAPADPVAAFIGSALRAVPGATTAFADIQRAWEAFCERHGIRSDAINLGIALKAAGYDRTRMSNRKVGYVGVAVAA